MAMSVRVTLKKHICAYFNTIMFMAPFSYIKIYHTIYVVRNTVEITLKSKQEFSLAKLSITGWCGSGD